MANLLESQPLDEPNLFSDLGEKAFIPVPVKDYPLTHYLKLADNVPINPLPNTGSLFLKPIVPSILTAAKFACMLIESITTPLNCGENLFPPLLD